MTVKTDHSRTADTCRCNPTSFQQGGAPARDGRAVSSGGASDHFEDVMAAGVQRVQLDVGHTGVADHLDLQRAVGALHLYRGHSSRLEERRPVTEV